MLNPEISPDGRWIAYSSTESGRMEVYVRPFPDVEASRDLVSRDGGWSPVWAANGRELYFRATETFDMMVVSVDTDSGFRAGTPEMLFKTPYVQDGLGSPRQWDVSADGRFLMMKNAERPESVVGADTVYVQHWFEELKARVPVP